MVTLAAALPLTAATCQKPALAASPAALSVPGMDFSSLPPAAQKELGTVFTDEFCYCGCPHTLGSCLRQHTSCRHARRMASLAALQASDGFAATEIILGLSKYYASFREKRHAFTVDERMCKGPKDAKVTVVEFSDFECPYCAAAVSLLNKLVQSGAGKVRVCYKPYPLQSHQHAVVAAQAALHARDKGKFWEMHDALFENQLSLSAPFIKGLSSRLGLNAGELGKVFESKKYVDELDASKEAGKGAGVDSTPALFFNGRRHMLGPSLESLLHAVDDEIEWAAQKGWAPDA
jgi:protein-disulfide isomerase